MKLDAADLLDALCAQLIADGANSRDLRAIEFNPDGNTVQLLTGKRRMEAYPKLALILETIGNACAAERIGAQQLRCINFLEEEIKLEMVSRSGDQTIIYAFPLED
jgi:hypothetical protein